MNRIHRLLLVCLATLALGLAGCGGGTEPVCEAATCESLGVDCGEHDDNCGGTVSCGDPCETCEPRTACDTDECGTVSDGCEGTLECGGCETGYTCSAENACVADCTPESDAELCTAESAECGSITATDTCGTSRTAACGSCGTGYTCDAGTCVESTCEAATCASLGHACGTWDDGCGGTVDCLDCAGQNEECEAGQCVCVARTCEQLGRDCGEWNDGCGGRVTCGPCESGDICRFDGLCIAQCVPQTCADAGAECGTIQDGCGGTVNCDDEVGGCTGGDVCGGDGPNLCGTTECTALTCDDLYTSDGIECGEHSDGCGDLITCGPCATSERCTSAYVCEPRCVQTTCEAEGAECGIIDDGCGGTLNCDVLVGGCTGEEVCGGDGPNRCGEEECTPETCTTLGYQCGSWSDGCGSVLDCDTDAGGCGTGETCDGGQCVDESGEDGSACEIDDECQGGFCVSEADYGWRHGYCTGTCLDDGDCTTGAHCAFQDGTGEGFCMASCTDDDDCRDEGYICFDGDGQGRSECLPGAGGEGAVGDACEGYWECDGREFGFCADLWPNGYCMINCGADGTDCPDGSTCVAFGDTAAYCTADCGVDGDCRDDYYCAPLDDDAGDVCLPGCRDDGECAAGEVCHENTCLAESTDAGEPCAANGDCEGGLCFDEETYGWYQGYCSGECAFDADCGLDALCSFRDADGDGVCLKLCEVDDDCRAGYICGEDELERGICIVGADGDGAVGASCEGYWDCDGRDRGFCIDSWPDGYCSEACGDDFTCPDGSECVGAPDGDGGTFWFCVDECASANECREGYACTDIGLDVCLPEEDDSGISTVGGACAVDGDCAGDDPACISQADYGWYQGYCTGFCETDADCGTGAHCYYDTDDEVGFCFRACTQDSECRTGYGCYDYTEDGRTECAPLPVETGDGEVGDACIGYFECDGVHSVCFDQETTGFPGGYCSIFCGDGGSDCPLGSVCIESYCWQSCTSNDECREDDGYYCDTDDTCFPQ